MNIQNRGAYPNGVITNEFANNFACSSVKIFLILRNAWSLNLAVLHNLYEHQISIYDRLLGEVIPLQLCC